MTAVLSPERVGRITGSRIAAALEESPYQTRQGLLREMVRQALGAAPEFTGNTATEWGQLHEKDGIQYWEQVNDSFLVATGEAQKFFRHPVHDFLGATPDGIAIDGIVQVKAPLWGSYTHISEVPWTELQMRLEMECAGADWADLVIWRETGSTISTIFHDPAWLPSVLPRLLEFIGEYRQIVADETLAAPYLRDLVDVRTDREFADAEAKYAELAALAKVAAEAEKTARDELVALAGGHSARGQLVSVNVTERKGSIDWARVQKEELGDLNVDGYRKPPTSVTSVRVL